MKPRSCHWVLPLKLISQLCSSQPVHSPRQVLLNWKKSRPCRIHDLGLSQQLLTTSLTPSLVPIQLILEALIQPNHRCLIICPARQSLG